MKYETGLCLKRILAFSIKIKERTQHISLDDYLKNDFLQEAVMYCLGQIGEIASKISDDEQKKYPQIFWDLMVGLRHRLFHDYEAINHSKVYEITQEPISELIRYLQSILHI
jgi:uncharacterized protein with HEPN domain